MSGGKFLIVEDEFVVAENLRSELESLGHQVLGPVSSGEDAVDLARREKPDIVLMDVKLLGAMDGVETAIHLRESLDVPSLFLTAFADERLLERAKLAQPLGYLVKPYGTKGLRASIEMAHYKARMERLLKDSESRFRTMFENSPVAYLALDATDRLLDLNFETCALLGYPEEELLGKPFIELWPHETRRLYDERLSGLKHSGRISTELELIRKDRTSLIVHLEGRVQQDIESQTLRWHCILHNITERKHLEEERARAEQALWRQYELQRVLLSAIPAYVYIKDTVSVYLVGNKQFSELSGVPEDEIPGKTDFDFFTEADAVRFRKDDAEIIASGKGRLNYEVMGTDAEGKTIWYSTSKIPFHGPAGEVAGMIGVCMNITDRKRAEEQRLLYEQRLQQAQKATSLAQMAGAIAHHYNNLLGAVIGNLELALDDVPKGSSAHTCAAEAMKASTKAAEISQLMLTYLGQTIVMKEYLDLTKAIREAQDLLSSSLPETIRFETDFPPQGPIIRADKAHITQILSNLLSNAVEALEGSEGHIKLAVVITTAEELQKSKYFPVDWEPKEERYACVSVADNGPGLDAGSIERIFDPFFTTRFTGRGLGLPVILGLTRAYEGAVTVESGPGKGAVFRVCFPLQEQTE